MADSRKIIKNIASLLFSGFFAQLVNFLVILYLARLMGPDGFGKINFAMAVAVYFTLATTMGLTTLGIREVARAPSSAGALFVPVTQLRLALFVVLYALLAAALPFAGQPRDIGSLILLFSLAVLPAVFQPDWLFQGLEEMEYVGAGRLAYSLSYAALVLFFIKNARQMLFVPLCQLAAMSASVGLLLVIYVRRHGMFKICWEPNRMMRLARESAHLGFSTLLIQAINNIGVVMMGLYGLVAGVGYYNASYKIIASIALAGSVYFDAVFPVTANLYKTSLERLGRFQSRTLKLVGLFTLPIGVGGVLLSGKIIAFFYGPAYAPSAGVFGLLCWLPFIVFLNTVYARGLWACDGQAAYLRIVLVQVAVNLGCNLALIPHFGMYGVAAANICAELSGFMFYHGEFNKIVRVPAGAALLKPLLASCGMGAVLQTAKLLLPGAHVFLLIALGAACYAMIILAIGGLKWYTVRDFVATIVKKKAQTGGGTP
ncbi:MAG: flippase [Elusimicrobiales bacterium]|nr:flippase [Elusimicrobiales bacterium]